MSVLIPTQSIPNLLFGNGSDGDLTLTLGTTTLTSDMYYHNLDVPVGQILETNGFRIFVSNRLTLDGIIRNNGFDASSTGGGAGAGGITATLYGGGAGGTGPTSDTPVDGNVGQVTASYQLGGNGGSGASVTTPNGGVVTLPPGGALQGASLLSMMLNQITLTNTRVGGGAGGGSGGSQGGFSGTANGGGGGGGGVVFLMARTLVGSGSVEAHGGAGGPHDPADTNDGAGGGGGGGVIFIASQNGLDSIQTNVDGGAAGSPNAQAGSAGQLFALFPRDVTNVSPQNLIKDSLSGYRNSGWIFGRGTDGDVEVTTTINLLRDMYYNNLTVGSNGVINVSGFRIFVAGTLTLTQGGTIAANGSNGSQGMFGGTGGIGGGSLNSNNTTLGGGSLGGNGGMGNPFPQPGSAGTSLSTALGSAGGTGGTPLAGGGNGGSGGTVNLPTVNAGAGTLTYAPLWTFPCILRAQDWAGNQYQGGTGGGGGGGASDGGGYRGGGGGGGGGVVYVAARILDCSNGYFAAKGGDGGGGEGFPPNGAGGGGGGGGGVVILIYSQQTGGIVYQLAGGFPGIGGGAMSGSPGQAIQLQV